MMAKRKTKKERSDHAGQKLECSRCAAKPNVGELQPLTYIKKGYTWRCKQCNADNTITLAGTTPF